jgi:hypothetical protein
VPPSSPPQHATATDVPSSPFFEPRHHAFSLKSSSPPPLFSSDDSRESADVVNYESPRIFKNKRKGAWWDNGESAHSTPESKKARMTRNYDSGVYMMSDSTDSSESLLPQHKSPFGLDGTCDALPQDEPPQPPRSQMGRREDLFCKNMLEGLEKNSQTYDFRGYDLQDSDIRRIGELASVIKNVPDPGSQLPAEGQYRSMVPELYVNLSDNRLHRLTPSLFNVQNLTTLVLVDNDIEELPACISQLHNLQELNISRNNIRWLPFEFLELYRSTGRGILDILGDSGVPWLHPKARQEPIPNDITHAELWTKLFNFISESGPVLDLAANPHLHQMYNYLDSNPDREQLVWYMRFMEMSAQNYNNRRLTPSANTFVEHNLCPHHPTIKYGGRDEVYACRYMARTPVAFFDEAGVLVKGSAKPPSSNDDDFAVITETSRGAHGVPASWFLPPNTKASNSLLTMSLHSALRYKDQDDLTISDLRHHIGEPVPPVADALLKQAELNDGDGYGEFKKCHVCRKEYVMTRAEWIEWWCTKPLVILPFKVQVCSWGCVPEAILKRPEKELDWK